MSVNRRRLLTSAAAGIGAASVGPFFIRDLRAEDVVKIAGIHDTSGGLDIYGKQMVATMDLAVNEINDKGGVLGKKIKLINYDPQSNIQFYTQYATEAATKEKVAVVHGGITSASREAIRPLLKRFNTLYFYNTLYEGGVCDRNIFCTGSTPAQTLEKLVPYLMKKAGKKIYTIAADYNYGQITAKWVKKYAQDNGGSVVQTDFFPLDVTDFGPTIKKIQAAKPDAVMSALVGAAHISFYRQWAAAGMNKQIPLASTTFGNEVVITSPEEHNGILVVFGYLEGIDTPVNKAFVETIRSKYSIPHMTELAAMTYHGVHMWAEAVKKANSIDRMKVIEALESGLTFTGPAGKTTLDAKTHHNILDVYIGEARDKKFVVLEKFPVQMPADTAAVCDLKKNPNDNKQYVIDVKT
ncbi:ABC transporter substrate-binding protein [Reyranella sp. CPCC 100927]|uniref:urea ABC transporter substrate-binding protein n=1 Tax=Reyranella sp. CPCC 100927 TaxID=2599616 RepID=UPI0011B36DDC|nr:ABC transporter substrate-binding protein [Reyranella sp. CPCC 100927]TWT11396.1 transporter substrate-binding protein [Reyranella sp. CPCC 100927]